MSARVAVIGCGAAARRLHLPGLRGAGFEIAAVWSRTRSSAEAASHESGGRVLDAWSQALDPKVADAVVVCTPNALHAEVVVAAASAGLHALVEKPMATTLDDADAMIDAASRAGTTLMVAHNARFAPPVAAVAAAIRTGAIGQLRSARLVLRNPGPQAWAPGSSWFTDPALSGGGALMDLGVHLADALRALTGREVVRARAACRPEPPNDVDAHAVLTLDDGTIASIHVGWDAPLHEFSLTVSGSDAIAHADMSSAPRLVRPGAEPEPIAAPDAGDVWSAFARAIAGTEQPAASGRDGRAALAIVLAAYRSVLDGKPVVPVGA